MVSYFTGYGERLDKSGTLVVAAFQALLLTNTLLVFIRPEVVKARTVVRQVVAIGVCGVVLHLSLFFFPAAYVFLFRVLTVGYVCQLVGYTTHFTTSFRHTLRRVENYYDEDERGRLRWVERGFYGMLAIGLMALGCLFFGIWFYLLFVPAFVVCYAYVAMGLCSYIYKMKFILPVIAVGDAPDTYEHGQSAEATDTVLSVSEANLKDALDAWVARKAYTQKDIPVDDIAKALGTTCPALRRFLKDRIGMDFRTWRNELRLYEACRLFRENPECRSDEVRALVGYGDKGNFRKAFRKKTGCTPIEYAKRCRSETQ